MARCGLAGRGKAWRGMAVEAWPGTARSGRAWQSRRVWRGAVLLGMARFEGMRQSWKALN